MSGIYSVKFLLDTLGKSVLNEQDLAVTKELGLLDKRDRAIKEQVDCLREAGEVDEKQIVHLADGGKLKFLPALEESKPVAAKEKGKGIATDGQGSGTKSEPAIADNNNIVNFSAAALREILEGKSFTLDQERIKGVLEGYIKDLPKTAETYKTGDISIFAFEGIEMTISSLLSAGTMILDAILFMTYCNSQEHNFIFSVTKMSPDTINKKHIVESIDLGNKALKAAFCAVYNQGSLPVKNNDQRNLSNFIRMTIFRNNDLKSDMLCKYLSTADPTFFPAAVFLKIPLDYLPTEVSSRCKMSIAGNKAIRYAVLAQKFERRRMVAPDVTNQVAAHEYFNIVPKLQRAKDITELLCSIASNFEAQKRMHPLSPTRPSRKNFTLQLTCAIIFSLSDRGRLALRSSIDDNRIEAFKRDINFYGNLNNANVVNFPVLANPEADFSELSVEAVRAAYGLI